MLEPDRDYFLREDAYFEPLINGWFAWPYLIPPLTAARYICKTHRRIMNSFVNNSKLHILANQEEVLTGGEFLNATEEHVGEIRAMVSYIDESLKDVVAVSTAIDELETLLQQHTSGETIEKLYPFVPETLKGFVELHMDLSHHASYRIIEPLIYDSSLYKTSLQSASFGILQDERVRPFVFSTPRLADENHFQIEAEFNSPDLECILAARTVPMLGKELNSIFEKYMIKGGLAYEDIFTQNAPTWSNISPENDEVVLQFIGHAGFLVQTTDVKILIDPVLANRGQQYWEEVYSYADLPEKIDYICITHTHQDHIHIETLLQLRHKTDLIVAPKNNGGSLTDPSIKLMLKALGFEVIEVEDMDAIQIPGGSITALPFLGEHGDLNIRSKAAWLVRLFDGAFFFGADSSNLDPYMYRHIKRYIGDVDVLALGMECVGAPYTWLYGALHTKTPARNIRESRRLNGSDARQAMQMIETFEPNQVFIYALGQEPWLKHLMGIDYNDDSLQIVETQKTIEFCLANGVPAENLVGKKRFVFGWSEGSGFEKK